MSLLPLVHRNKTFVSMRLGAKETMRHSRYEKAKVKIKTSLCSHCVKRTQIQSYFWSYFPVFSPDTGKYGPEITPYLDTFYAVSTLRCHNRFFWPRYQERIQNLVLSAKLVNGFQPFWIPTWLPLFMKSPTVTPNT